MLSLLLVILVGCDSKEKSTVKTKLELKLIKSIKLEGIIEEKPYWNAIEDRIFFSCPFEKVVRVVNFEGKMLAELDKIGEGPGEISGFGLVYIHKQSREIEYDDFTNDRSSIFDYNLNYIRTLPAKISSCYYMYDYPDRKFKLMYNPTREDGKYITNISAEILFADSTKQLASSSFDVLNYNCISEFHVAANDEVILVGQALQDVIDFEVFDLDGNTLNRVKYSYPRIRKCTEEFEDWEDIVKGGGIDYSNWKDYSSIEMIFADFSNRAWILNHNEAKNFNLLVFSPDGELQDEFDLGTRLCDVKVHNDKIFKLSWDKDDNYKIEIYQIEG